jgi:preprotein translocase subunit YajC
MNVRNVVGLLVGLVLVVSTAQAQTNVRIRGTISGIDGKVLAVKSRDGKDLKIELADNVAVAVAKKIAFEDIKKGDYVGATTMPGPNGTQVAVEVHYLAPTTPEGQIAWDLQPGSTMTNANVDSMVVGAGNNELTLTYKGGTQKIVVVPSTALVRTVPGTRADLVVGEYVFIGAQQAADGALSAARVQVSKDGVKPPQ